MSPTDLILTLTLENIQASITAWKLCFFLEKTDCVQLHFLCAVERKLHALTTFFLPKMQLTELKEVWSWSSLFIRKSSTCSSSQSNKFIFTGSSSSVQVPIRKKDGKQPTSQKKLQKQSSWGKKLYWPQTIWIIKLPVLTELGIQTKTVFHLELAYLIWKLHRKLVKPIVPVLQSLRKFSPRSSRKIYYAPFPLPYIIMFYVC